MTTVVQGASSGFQTADHGLAERKGTPIKWWAGCGAAFLLLQVYVLTRWVVSGQATRTPTGPDPMPGYTRVAIQLMDTGLPILALIVAYHYVVRPWRRDGHLSTDGMLLIGWVSLYLLQDPILNYTQNWFLYNSAHFNFGSWTSQIPGWNSPRGHLLPEPLLTWASGYVVFGFIPTVWGCWFLRVAKRRWPQMGKLGLISTLFALFVVLDFCVEAPFLRLNTYAYAGSIRWLTIWSGRTYQFPIYEMAFLAVWWTSLSALRFYRDDRGRTCVERGIEKVRGTPRRKQALKLLAIIGFTHVVGMVGYNIPMQWFGTHSDSFPKGYKSWMLNGMCGQGTPYECGGPEVPINRPKSKAFPPGSIYPAPEHGSGP